MVHEMGAGLRLSDRDFGFEFGVMIKLGRRSFCREAKQNCDGPASFLLQGDATEAAQVSVQKSFFLSSHGPRFERSEFVD